VGQLANWRDSLNRRRVTVVVLSAAVLLLGGGAAWWLSRQPAPCPPAPLPENLSSLDPELAGLVSDLAEQAVQGDCDAEARTRLANVYEANNMYSLAVETYAQLLDRDPDDGVVWFRYAMCLEREGNLDQAISAMDRSIALEPEFAASRWRQADWLLSAGDLERAGSRIDESLGLDPRDRSALLLKAKWFSVLGDSEAAIELIRERGLEQGPNAAYARYLLGMAYRQLGQLEQAEALLTGVSNVRPAWSDAWSQEIAKHQIGLGRLRSRSTAHVKQGRWEQAIPLLTRLLEGEPGDVTGWNTLGICYLKLRQIVPAVAAFRKALALNEQHFGSNLNLSMALLEQSESEPTVLKEAARLARRACELRPDAGMSREGYARILFQMNRKAEARAAFLTAFRLDPKQRDCAIEAGLIGIELGEWEAAVNCFSQLEKPSGPPEADLLIGLARLRLHQGDVPGARRLLAEARKSTVISHHTPGRLERLALALEAESGAGAKTGSDG